MKLHLTFKSRAELDEYRRIHLRTTNTFEPHHWPHWLTTLDSLLERLGREHALMAINGPGDYITIDFDPTQGEAT